MKTGTGANVFANTVAVLLATVAMIAKMPSPGPHADPYVRATAAAAILEYIGDRAGYFANLRAQRRNPGSHEHLLFADVSAIILYHLLTLTWHCRK